jgi:hypothetical protein
MVHSEIRKGQGWKPQGGDSGSAVSHASGRECCVCKILNTGDEPIVPGISEVMRIGLGTLRIHAWSASAVWKRATDLRP